MEIKEIDTGEFKSFYKASPPKAQDVPDLSAKGPPQRRSDPFILTDFKGIDAHQNITT